MESSRAVLRVLVSHGPVTRPRLGMMLGFSKPTMSAAVAELSALSLVAPHGSEKGPLGRTAQIYGLGPKAGYIIGIDVGTTQVRVLAHALDGRRLAAVKEQIVHPPTAALTEEAVWSAVRQAISLTGSGHGGLHGIAVAVPRIVSPSRVALDEPAGPAAALRRLRRQVDVPILLENNVNCAAIAEMHDGAAKGRDTFAYLQVGVRIGLGIVVNGRLFRGAGGAAGEVGRLPFPWSPGLQPVREGLEHYLGSQALVERCAIGWPAAEGPPPSSAEELFARAAAGSGDASLWVARHAADIGRLVAACIGILDPGLIVLGGGVGQNPLLLPEVERVAGDLAWPTQIATSPLGNAATVLGAAKLAADHCLGAILGEDRHSAVVLPPLGEAASSVPG